jgi:hypothetical protein
MPVASPSPDRSWKVAFSPEVQALRVKLSRRDSARVDRLVERLEHFGPQLGRPHADHVKGSRHHNMKELRTRGSAIRILYAFDPGGTAQLLVGGDKRGAGDRWMSAAVKQADRQFSDHLEQARREGRWPHTARAPGRASTSRGR